MQTKFQTFWNCNSFNILYEKWYILIYTHLENNRISRQPVRRTHTHTHCTIKYLDIHSDRSSVPWEIYNTYNGCNELFFKTLEHMNETRTRCINSLKMYNCTECICITSMVDSVHRYNAYCVLYFRVNYVYWPLAAMRACFMPHTQKKTNKDWESQQNRDLLAHI